MRRFLLAIFVATTLALSASAAPPAPTTFLLRITRPGAGESGTGFAVIYGGKAGVLTAWHVVNVPDHPYGVKGGDRDLLLVFRRVAATDVAFAPAAIPSEWRIVRLGASPVVGGSATIWGLPGVGGLVSSQGPVKSISTQVDYTICSRGTFLNVAAPVWPGMSGGPCVDATGAAFGVASAYRHLGDRVEAIVSEIPAP